LFAGKGDTPVTERPTIRKKARIIMTNPDMLHCAMLPSHSLWGPFLRNLRFIVIDEAHHYRPVPTLPASFTFLASTSKKKT
jgi:DEAD/DEAH box helicase domain-containing protein